MQLYDEGACSEVSSNWESDGSALFDDIDEGETYEQQLDHIEEEKQISQNELEAARQFLRDSNVAVEEQKSLQQKTKIEDFDIT